MRFHRPFLYAGVFLATLGGIGLAADAGAVDVTALGTVVRLWPLAIIAVGLGLVLRRTRLSLAGGLAAAIAPALLIGSAFAALPRITDHCGAGGAPARFEPQQGTFESPALVSIETGCGSLAVVAAPGSGWRVDGGNAGGLPPTVVATLDTLTIEPARDGWEAFAGDREELTVTLPVVLGALHLDVNAGRATVTLPGARMESVVVTANLADVLVDLSDGEVGDVVAEVNMGHMALLLPGGRDITGRLDVGAANLDVCIPDDAGLRVSTHGSTRRVTFEGVAQGGGEWLGPRYDAAAYHIDLEATIGLGSIDINPPGGCR